jgi:hypothetical protein
MTTVLRIAAAYNCAFGIATGIAPAMTLAWLGLNSPTPREQAMWQCIAMIVGVYGVAYFFASRAPLRHWPVILAGLLGKILGPIGFCVSALNGVLPWRMGLIIVLNDIIWWAPFILILLASYRVASIEKQKP